MTVVDLFCGIGVGLALRELGITEHGIDNEPHVAATRERLGMATTCADITTLDPRDWAGADGVWASPPCTDWSRAGKGLGMEGPTGRLVFEPIRWVEAIRPRWVAMEQVPEAAPAFRAMAHALEGMGYRAAVARMSSEEWGVPQTRERVYLMAHRDRSPRLPSPTHQPYKPGVPPERPANLMGLLPWVSMAEALGWDGPAVFQMGQYGQGPFDPAKRPSMTLVTDAGTSSRDRWAVRRSATTVACDERLPPAGHHDRQMTNAIKLTTAQGCRLMGFPDPDEVAAALPPSKRPAWQIIGNAVCSPMATVIVRSLTTEATP